MAATTLAAAVKSALAPTPSAAKSAPTIAFKAQSFQDEDGVIIGKVSVANVRDAERERASETALKAATWELAMKGRPVDVDVNHDVIIGCDVVGVYYDYSEKASIVHLKPHDYAVYEAAKSGQIVGMSWSGPYLLSEDDQ